MLNEVVIVTKDGPAVTTPEFSHWDKWNSREYLRTYFTKLGQDSFETLEFIINAFKKIGGTSRQKILDFGSGPTIFAALAAAQYASEIHISDYLNVNLEEIRKWLSSDKNAFDWTHCTEKILELEGSPASSEKIIERFLLLRQKPVTLLRSDASLSWPLFSSGIERYPIVITNFCADSVTSSKEVWKAYMKNILNLVAFNGHIIVSALRNCQYYRSGAKFFPSADIDENDLRNVILESGFRPDGLTIVVKEVPECIKDGFSSIIFAEAQKFSERESITKEKFRSVSLHNIRRA